MQTTNDFNKILKERRSIKRYDPTVKISREEMEEILTVATTAPSSVNMQPWRFLVIESDEAKAQLAELAKFNSTQVETSAAVIAVFGDVQNVEYFDEIYDKAVEVGYMPQEVKDNIKQAFSSYFETISNEDMKDVVLIDGGLVSMQIMLAARAYGYDTNPIGGYEKEKVTEVFGMDKERHVPVMLISIGKAVDEGHPSVRLPINRVAEWK
ncbi:nitroreductase family protein [Priestia flexa]|jgi:nitroreductase|uniref:Nitroreductase family protein n=1 Tax=Priestia flexa TaxID=86664 RepID=A0A8I1SNX1_9BACI|nr:nitroreductase family protein [Priestia flexa]MBN8252889.1 nitroreductase family protein [Priestia flexa]MBN8435310.1 nitroreductase family protein [Priestia flexa]MCA0967776.1 nitroreductase family protein [Priestia flexa]RIV13106.1 nitroreductase family protein [Priestia flexa]UIR30452.1 nitroreductase family protein [Priestia flexa]